MDKLVLSDDFFALPSNKGESPSGEIFQIVRNRHGGSTNRPVARYFVTLPVIYPEGFNPHWRVDCFALRSKTAPSEKWLAERLAEALLAAGLVEQPIWLSWHISTEVDGKPIGKVFDYE